MNRPAETAAVAGAIALLIGYVAGIDDRTILTAIGVVIGFIPAAITWLVVTFRKPKPKAHRHAARK
jgi:cell division protein FtsW (lipid II flippase)